MRARLHFLSIAVPLAGLAVLYLVRRGLLGAGRSWLSMPRPTPSEVVGRKR